MTGSLFKRCGCTTPITGADGRTRWTTPGDTCPDRPAGRCVEHQPRHVVVLYRGAERDHATQDPDPTRRLSDTPRGRRGTVSNSCAARPGPARGEMPNAGPLTCQTGSAKAANWLAGHDE